MPTRALAKKVRTITKCLNATLFKLFGFFEKKLVINHLTTGVVMIVKVFYGGGI